MDRIKRSDDIGCGGYVVIKTSEIDAYRHKEKRFIIWTPGVQHQTDQDSDKCKKKKYLILLRILYSLISKTKNEKHWFVFSQLR